MSQPLFSVLRYVVIGQRQYNRGDELTAEDVECWMLPADQVQKVLTEAVAKGQIEPVEQTPAAAAVVHPAGPAAPAVVAPHPAEPVVAPKVNIEDPG